MGETLTNRLALIKPNRDTATPLDVERLNLNFDNLDKAAGMAMTNDGTTPPVAELYDGKIVREKTSGSVWVAEKQTDGSYTKRWIKFPYLMIAYSDPTVIGAMGTWQEWGFPKWWPTSYNAPSSELVGGRWYVPFKGIYQLRYNHQFTPTAQAGQIRSSVFTIDGTPETGNTEFSHINNGGTTQANSASFSRVLNTGQNVCTNILVSGPFGPNPTVYTTLEVNCIERLD